MLTTLENRPPTKPKVDLNTEPARNAMNALIADLSSRRVPPLYVDIIRRYKTVGNPGRTGGGGSERTASDEAQRVGGVTSGRVITVPEITVVEAADGRATAQEILNRLAGLAY